MSPAAVSEVGVTEGNRSQPSFQTLLHLHTLRWVLRLFPRVSQEPGALGGLVPAVHKFSVWKALEWI